MIRSLFALLILVCSTAALATPPQHVSATYSLSRNGFEMAQVVEHFTRGKTTYSIESITSAIGVYRILTTDSIKLLSHGNITLAGLQPVHFEHHRGSRVDKRIVADFDWKEKLGTFRFDGNTKTEAIPAGMQDRISLMYQFMFMSQNDFGHTVAMSNGKKVSEYEYERVGEENLETIAGTFRTLHLKRKPIPGDDTAEVWLALDRSMIAVKVLVIEEKKGTRLEQVLTGLSIN